jgi:hypothetical protein
MEFYPLKIFGHTFNVSVKTLLITILAKTVWATIIFIGCLFGIYHFGNTYFSNSGLICVFFYIFLFFQVNINDKNFGFLSHNKTNSQIIWMISYIFFIYSFI